MDYFLHFCNKNILEHDYPCSKIEIFTLIVYSNSPINAVAIPKYMRIDVKSFNVVINGPDATAGSILILSIINGIIAPDNVATVKVTKMAIPTSTPRKKFPFQK